MAQKRAEVRTRKINWGAYLQSGIINQDQFDHIIMLDKYAGQKRAWVYRENPTIVAQYLFELLQRISKDDTVQYLLTLIDDSLHVSFSSEHRHFFLRDYTMQILIRS